MVKSLITPLMDELRDHGTKIGSLTELAPPSCKSSFGNTANISDSLPVTTTSMYTVPQFGTTDDGPPALSTSPKQEKPGQYLPASSKLRKDPPPVTTDSTSVGTTGNTMPVEPMLSRKPKVRLDPLKELTKEVREILGRKDQLDDNETKILKMQQNLLK